jgi:hypothetical protein
MNALADWIEVEVMAMSRGGLNTGEKQNAVCCDRRAEIQNYQVPIEI